MTKNCIACHEDFEHNKPGRPPLLCPGCKKTVKACTVCGHPVDEHRIEKYTTCQRCQDRSKEYKEQHKAVVPKPEVVEIVAPDLWRFPQPCLTGVPVGDGWVRLD